MPSRHLGSSRSGRDATEFIFKNDIFINTLVIRLRDGQVPEWRLRWKICPVLPVWHRSRGPGSRVSVRIPVLLTRRWRKSWASLWRTICRWRCGWSWHGRPCRTIGNRWWHCNKTSTRALSPPEFPNRDPYIAANRNNKISKLNWNWKIDDRRIVLTRSTARLSPAWLRPPVYYCYYTWIWLRELAEWWLSRQTLSPVSP